LNDAKNVSERHDLKGRPLCGVVVKFPAEALVNGLLEDRSRHSTSRNEALHH